MSATVNASVNSATDAFMFIRPRGYAAVSMFAMSYMVTVSESSIHRRHFKIENGPVPGTLDLAQSITQTQNKKELGRIRRKYTLAHRKGFSGCWKIQLDSPESEDGWTFGPGSHSKADRGVQILMYACDQANTDWRLGSIRLHPQTGVAMVVNQAQSVQVSYKLNHQWTSLEKDGVAVLHEHTTIFRFGEFELEFEYAKPSQERGIKGLIRDLRAKLSIAPGGARDIRYKTGYLPLDGSASARMGYRTAGQYLAIGGSGVVHNGIEVRTGNAVAVKSILLRRPSEKLLGKLELAAWRAISSIPGNLKLLKAFCEHGEDPDRCDHDSDVWYFASKLAICDCSPERPIWEEFSEAVHVELFHQLFEGLAGLHADGWIHGDVSCKNMLIMSIDPPRAVIHDFGTALRVSRRYDSPLGPPAFAAPEMEDLMVRSIGYTNRVEIFSLGMSFFYILTFGDWVNYQGTTLLELRTCYNHLDDLDRSSLYPRSLTQLIRRMIWLTPDERPTANEALRDQCWDFRSSYEESSRYCTPG